MNRLLNANGLVMARRPLVGQRPPIGLFTYAVGLGILYSLASSTDLSAQLPLPPGAKVPAASNVATSEAQSVATDQLIKHVRAAMNRKDYRNAVELFRHSAASVVRSPQMAPQVEQLRAELVSAGFDRDLLSMPPTGPLPSLTLAPAADSTSPLGPGATPPIQRLPSVAKAEPIGGPADIAARKQEALRLIAIGRASLDRGETSTALTLARQAQALNVPEREFSAGEPRVWQLLLDAESSARKSGIALTSGTSPIDNASGVKQADGSAGDIDSGAVAQMLFNGDGAPNAGNSFVGDNPAGGIAQVQNLEALPGDANDANKVYQEGLDLLISGDQAGAREKFLEAWKHESTLDLETRRQLKDKLTLLQSNRIGGMTAAKEAGAPLTPIERAQLENQEKTRRLYREVTSELAKANESKTTAPMDALDQLDRLKRRVETSDLDESGKRSLTLMVDRALQDQRQYVDANRAKIEMEIQNETIRTTMATESQREAAVDDEIANLVQEFNQLIESRRFNEAEVVAKQVSELKPGSPIAITMFHNARMQVRGLMNQEIRDAKEDAFVTNMLDVERASIGIDPERNFALPEARIWEDLSRRRLAGKGADERLSAREQEIKRSLSTDVNVKYRNRPLHEVLEDLAAVTGVPIVMDSRSLSAVRVTPDTPVNLSLQKSIPLKSALSLILANLELTYVIENDVLNITSIEAKRSKVFPRTYRVTDLVTPIPNFTSSYEDGLAGALRAAYQMSSPQSDVQIMPVSPTDLGRGMAATMSPSQMAPNMLGQFAPGGSQGGFGPGNSSAPSGARGGSSFADFDSLMRLIETTVVPDTWEALGGPSTMAEYRQNLSLVISTTSDVHDQISDLLTTLRRLQNLQITIEVRFITLSDTFFEQIGVDFDVQFKNSVSEIPQGNSGPAVTIGFDGITGAPTPDLDIRFDNNSFGIAPPFSAPDPGAISTIGFAILSDIEAFFFLQAAQGDTRNNVMQAPKVTLFDGQIATISDVSQRPFVTSITPVVGDFAVAQQPVIVVLNEGTQLNVQGIVSDDKRFVRLTLVPFFSQIGNVDTFTFEGRRSTSSSSKTTKDTNGDGKIDSDDETDEDDSSDVVEGTTVQLPTFAFTQVSTTVSVPDGGTILLGGIKRLAEGRSERGVPFLSKIPYVSRLFRNVSTGRDARSLMLMVTPRIIIQEEEEIAQTGFDPNR
ncbi:Type IV pilus biogenesis and competence protein PilQ precursor [Novipirellula galeiformis]|uniref:Type IV pilus biogenesis and competence protein PilQ n=2 Tax=Novipirellula galeiformis TaxID=2528004 RepID=A0A5C6CB83_9BACT|nr:Type IV pilus biogenesis and competence protein PilQ precursor [Novipirellula galeiformis]